MTPNRLSPSDRVNVKVACDNRTVAEFTGTGFHNIEEAVNKAYEEVGASYPKEECVFTVIDASKGVESRYRINAHGHVKLIVEYNP